MPKMKLNFNALYLSNPHDIPARVVIPDRDIPGISARVCPIPMGIIFTRGIFSSFSLIVLRSRCSIYIKRIPIVIRDIAIIKLL